MKRPIHQLQAWFISQLALILATVHGKDLAQ